MLTLTRETPTSDSTGRSRRWFLPVTEVLVLILVAGGVWAILAAKETDDPVDVATELVDTWRRGWNENDEDAVRSVFTDDAVIRLRSYSISVDGYLRELRGGATTNLSRESDVTPAGEEGVFTFIGEFDYAGTRYSGEFEIELEDDLIARVDTTRDYTEVEP